MNAAKAVSSDSSKTLNITMKYEWYEDFYVDPS